MFSYTSVSSGGAAQMKGEDFDIEAGEKLYPGIGRGENQLRWGFIRKVYGILTAQIVVTTVVSATTALYAPITDLLRGNSALMLFLVFTPFILLWPLHVYKQKHPLNFVFLGLFTVSLSLTVGVTCANTEGSIVLEALILTSAVVSALTCYTFWASKKGKDFSFMGPFLFTALFVLVLAGFIQVSLPPPPIWFPGFLKYVKPCLFMSMRAFFPLGSTTAAIYSAIGAIIFSGYIVYDTDNLIKRHTYDDYIWASVTLYLDILNLFLTILRMLKQEN